MRSIEGSVSSIAKSGGTSLTLHNPASSSWSLKQRRTLLTEMLPWDICSEANESRSARLIGPSNSGRKRGQVGGHLHRLLSYTDVHRLIINIHELKILNSCYLNAGCSFLYTAAGP